MWLWTQSIKGLYQVSQWYPSTRVQLKSKDPESLRDINGVLGIDLEVTGIMRASGVVMEALRVTIVCAQMGEMQPPGGVGFWRLLSLFLPPQ